MTASDQSQTYVQNSHYRSCDFVDKTVHGRKIGRMTDFSKKTVVRLLIKRGPGEWGLFTLYGHEEILKKSSPKPLVRF